MVSNNLLVNGSFETGPNPGVFTFFPLFPGSKDIFGWDIIRGGIDYVRDLQTPADGNSYLDLNGTPGVGGVAQSFDTKVGQQYLVTFDLAAHPSGLLQTMRVSAAGKFADFSFQSKSDLNNLGWQGLTWEFTAISPQTTLEFYSLQTGYEFGGPALDGVVVTAINQINDTNGKNKLVGTAETDELNGLNGKDTLIGLGGNDILNGGNGSDTLIGVDATSTNANPTFFSDTGHYYEFVTVSDPILWQDAKVAAENRIFNGIKGHLVTITSQAENDFVSSLATSPSRIAEGWIGASDAEEEGIWKWVTGPEAGTQFWQGGPSPGGSTVGGSYANWGTFEPNNVTGPIITEGEDFAQIAPDGMWNDFPGVWRMPGYYVEYSSSPGAGEIDILTGGNGRDTFVLGDINKAYYDDGNPNTQGLLDYALITDFSNEDIIQLNGKANHYLLDETYSLGGSAGTAIFYKDTVNELIGFVEGVTGLNLKSNDFSFTGCL